MNRATFVRFVIFLATVVAAWGVLSLGTVASDDLLEVGDPAPRTYQAQHDARVVDTVATDLLKQEARDGVGPIRETNPEIENEVTAQVNAVFDDVEAIVIGDEPDTPTTTLPELPDTTTSTTEASDEGATTTTTLAALPAQIVGVVFIDVDGDGVYDPDAEGDRVDQGIERVSVMVSDGTETEEITTGPDGVWSIEVDEGSFIVIVDAADDAISEGYVVGTENLVQVVTCGAGEQCTAEPIGFEVNLRLLNDVVTQITATHTLTGDAVAVLAARASDDVIRAALGKPLRYPVIRQASLQRVLEEFGRRVTPEKLPEAQLRQRTSPPLVFHVGEGQDTEGGVAAGEVAAAFLQANDLIDAVQTEAAKEEAANAVVAVTVSFAVEQEIVGEGQPLTRLHIDAIGQTGSLVPRVQGQGGLLAVIVVLASLLGLYLATFRTEFWSRPRLVALFGILLVLAAASVRGTVIIHEATSWYVLPAVAFGFMTAVLFDSRIAMLMALSVGVLTAVGARDTGLAVYGVLAALAAVPFVSSVSSRGAFRNAVIFSSLTAAMVAAATSWFFHVGPNDAMLEVIGTSMVWAFGVSLIASLVGLAALQFFESAFDITTSLSLLDLTDRNHEALQLLQEKAFGSFNHSLMVGTLSHAAARAIGANALLARAMAYYHDLGKTENPTYFIENQFGIPNPHDQLTPKESAEVIRRHVSDGIALARKLKIPSDVATGIVSHHGDAVMRYFYEEARNGSGEVVDMDDFRHIGHKPRTAESAILMMADSLEAACRAVFQAEEPTPDAIEKVVNRVMDEKLEDGQLRESPLTLAELTRIREAFLDSLVGHYHQRIVYPNFPGS